MDEKGEEKDEWRFTANGVGPWFRELGDFRCQENGCYIFSINVRCLMCKFEHKSEIMNVYKQHAPLAPLSAPVQQAKLQVLRVVYQYNKTGTSAVMTSSFVCQFDM